MSPKQYDYLVIGAGLFGCVFAHEAVKKGKRVLVIDKRVHTGGNTYCEDISGIRVHKYGAHIFHTNDPRIWEYVQQFARFNHYINSPLIHSGGKLYNLPFNMNTFYQLWGVKTPAEAKAVIDAQVKESGVREPANLEEQALSLVGRDIYEKLIKGYTEKQWGRRAVELPAFIIKRIPLRFTFNNNYFNDRFQGIPCGGYNEITRRLLEGCEVRTGTDYFAGREYFNGIASKIVFTGKIDEFFNCQLGRLEYRSLRFESETLQMENFQGNAVVNYCDAEWPFTRIIEHKHFEFGTQAHTVITREYPESWSPEKEAYYPVNDARNQKIYAGYKYLAAQETGVVFGGRLAEYKYYDMHQVIASALLKTKQELI